MTRQTIRRAICQAQLNLDCTDKDSVRETIKYLSRALTGCFELQDELDRASGEGIPPSLAPEPGARSSDGEAP